MPEDMRQLLLDESGTKSIMIAKSLRLPKKLLLEIQSYIEKEKGIKESAILRTSLLLGWEEIKKQLDHDG